MSKEQENSKTLWYPPKSSGTMKSVDNESLMFFSYATHNNKRYRLFYGIGIVYRVVKGDKQDLVYINFGTFRDTKPRLVVTWDNHARRQIMTLKRGQVCQVYGISRMFTDEFQHNGETKRAVKMGLYAKGFLGWYVPTMLDIRKMPINEDLQEPNDTEKEIVDEYADVLERFMNDNGEEE